MADNAAITCGDVRKRLKPFLEDMLAEEEYQAFAAHLGACNKCRDYVGAIGSLSNRLWELGSVKVPPDFSSSVLHNLKQPPRPKRKPPTSAIKKVLAIVLISVGALSLIVFGFSRIMKGPNRPVAGDAPIVTSQMIQTPDGSIGEGEARALLGELKAIADGLGAGEKKEPQEAP